jgi:hypothetical protein
MLHLWLCDSTPVDYVPLPITHHITSHHITSHKLSCQTNTHTTQHNTHTHTQPFTCTRTHLYVCVCRSPDSAAARAAERNRFRTQRHRRSRSLDLSNIQRLLDGQHTKTGCYGQPNGAREAEFLRHHAPAECSASVALSSSSPRMIGGSVRSRRRARVCGSFLSDHRSVMLSPDDMLGAWLGEERLDGCRTYLTVCTLQSE